MFTNTIGVTNQNINLFLDFLLFIFVGIRIRQQHCTFPLMNVVSWRTHNYRSSRSTIRRRAIKPFDLKTIWIFTLKPIFTLKVVVNFDMDFGCSPITHTIQCLLWIALHSSQVYNSENRSVGYFNWSWSFCFVSVFNKSFCE